MRALALLIGLVLISNAEVLASNAPLTVDAQTADSGGDLFTPKSTGAAPIARPALPPPPPANPESSMAERGASRNPLWAIPLSRLTATRDQPLFAPSRRPPPVAEAARPVAAPVARPPTPPQPEKPQLSLLGTVAGNGKRIGLFIDPASKAVVRLKAGENHQGWTLRNVRSHQVELAKGLDSAVLDLPPPDMKPGPGVPMQAGPAPLASTTALPINTEKATGMLPSVVPAGAPRGQALMPNQSPERVNPFMQQPRPR